MICTRQAAQCGDAVLSGLYFGWRAILTPSAAPRHKVICSAATTTTCTNLILQPQRDCARTIDSDTEGAWKMETLPNILCGWRTSRDVAVAPQSPASPSMPPPTLVASSGRGESRFLTSLRTRHFLLVPGLAAALTASIGWTAWLMVLTISPNGTANYTTSTQRYDEGSFWLLQDPPASLMWFGVIALAIVAIGYVLVAVKLAKWCAATRRPRRRRLVPATPVLTPIYTHNERHRGPKRVADVAAANTRWRKRKIQPHASQTPSRAPRAFDSANRPEVVPSVGPRSSMLVRSHTSSPRSFASVSSDTAEFIVKVFDLGVQGVWLFEKVLETGSAIVFVALCTAAIVTNTVLWTWSIATGGSRLDRVLVELVYVLVALQLEVAGLLSTDLLTTIALVPIRPGSTSSWSW